MSQGQDTAIPVRPVTQSAPLPRATPGRDARGCFRPRSNEQLNSRLENALPAGKWQLKWQVPLEGSRPPDYLVQVEDRIIVPLGTFWEMFDRQGHRVATESLGEGEIVADPAHSLFYTPSPSGHINARNLNDGRLVFVTLGYGGPRFQRQLVARRGNRLLIVSVEFLGDAHGKFLPSTSVIEVQTLGDPIQVNDSKLLLSARRESHQVHETLVIPAALLDDMLVTAASNRLEISGLDLQKRRELVGEFEPRVMSLDEAGRLYLVVSAGQRVAVWVVTLEGARVMAAELPAETDHVFVPPIVGYNHWVYVVAGTRIMAIQPNGHMAWYHDATAPVAATVTSDDVLLVSAGAALTAFNEKGEPRLLYRFDGESLSTPAVLTARGEILVASQQTLFCLAPQPQPQR